MTRVCVRSVSVEKKEREKERKKGRKKVGHLEGHGAANNTKMIPREHTLLNIYARVALDKASVKCKVQNQDVGC